MRQQQSLIHRHGVRSVIEALENRQLLSADLVGVFAGKELAAFSVSKANKMAVRVSNVGDALAKGSVNVTLYTSTDAALDAGDTALVPGLVKSVNLKPGKGATLKLKVATPNITDGNYYILANVVPGAEIGDANLANNVAVTPSPVQIRQPFVDLTGTITSVKPTSLTIRGKHDKPLSVKVAIRNDGNIKASGVSSMSLFLSSDTNFDAQDTLLASGSKRVSISNGKSKSFSVKQRLDTSTPSGNFYVLARLNDNSGIAESDITNNVAVSAFPIMIVNTFAPPGPSLRSGLQTDVDRVVAGTSEIVHFSANVSGATGSTTAEVDEYDSAGNLVGKLTGMRDDGVHATGDVTANDGIFTGTTVVNFSSAGERFFVAKVSDPVLPNSLQSPTLTVIGVNAPSEGQLATDQQTAANATQVGQNVLNTGGSAQAAIDAVKAVLASDPNVQQTTIFTENGVVIWQTNDGITQGFDTTFGADSANLDGAMNVPAPAATNVKGLADGVRPAAAANPDPTLTVLILSPFHASLAGDPSAGIQTMFENKNYTVTYHQDANVTFNTFKNLDQYNAVQLYGHGSIIPHGGGEGIYLSVAPSLVTNLSNFSDMLLGRIIELNNLYVITPRFIGRYAGDMNGTIVEMNACNSCHDDTLADAFLNNGAAAYLGYTETVRAAFATSKANATWTTLLSDAPNNKVGDIPGVNVDHSVNVPPAYFVSRGDINATLPQPTLLANMEVYVHYTWPETQRDLDTNTTFLGASAGWSLDGGAYLSWTGDDTSNGGAETTTIDIGQAFTDGKWTTSTTFTAGADWYQSAGGSGPALLVVALEDKTTGVLSQGINRVISPGTETSGASTVVGTFTIVLGGDPHNPSVKLTAA